MTDERMRQFASYLYTHAFSLIDREIEFTGDDAGKIATAVEKAFVAACELVKSDGVPVEVIPLDVAVEAIACNAEYHNNSESWVVDVDGTRCYGGNIVSLHDSIAEVLRKAAK